MSDQPPPPPDWPPSAPAERSTPGGGPDFRVGDALAYGWSAFWRNPGPLIVMTAVILAANVALGLVAQATDGVMAVIAVQLLSLVVGTLLAMGLIRGALAVTSGQPPTMGMLTITDGFFPYLGALLLFVVLLAIGMAALVVPGVFVLVTFHLFGYAIVDRPELRPTDALRRSAQLTRGHRWQILGLILALFGLNVLGALACGIGVLFTYGISAVTLAYTFRTLGGQPVAPL